jgi:hypothetical protein
MKNILKKFVKIISISVIIFYALAISAMYFMQDTLIFEPNTDIPDPKQTSLPPLEEKHITTSDGIKLLVWEYIGSPDKPTILYFQGNAGNLETQARIVNPLMRANYTVIMVEFRGFGGNLGTPSELGLYEDARAGIKYAKSLGLKESQLILYGRSLGTAVVTKMATEIEAKGVILQAPFTSIPDVGANQYPFLPVHYLAKHHFDNLSRIKDITESLFIFHGDADVTVPPFLTKRLFEAANEPKQLVTIQGGGHSNIFLNGGNDAVLAWLSELQ